MKHWRATLKRWTKNLAILATGIVLGASATVYVLLDYNPPSLNQSASETTKQAETGSLQVENLPDHVINAFVAIEDRRFFSHKGIDLRAIGRAVRNNMGGEFEGAGTITMQLARNVVLQDRSRTLTRKLKEAFVALQLERNYTKDEIITAYLENAYYGAGSYGLIEASKTYFDKPVAELTIHEAALLAGLLKAPSVLSPFTNTEAALARRNIVLQCMREMEFIQSDTELERLRKLPLDITTRTDSSKA